MTRYVLLALMSVACAPAAAEGWMTIGGLPELAAEKVKETRAATLLTLDRTWGGAAYLPVWTWHAKYALDAQGQPVHDPMRDYVQSPGIGARLLEGGDVKVFVVAGLNLPGISNWLWSGSWVKERLTRSRLPPIWAGPFVRVPLPGETWVVGREIGGMVSIGLGSQ